MKDFRVQIRVKNNRIMQTLEEAGYPSIASFCRASGLSQIAVGELINFKKRPFLLSGAWGVTAQKMADFLLTTPDYLFSEVQKTLQIKRNTAEKTYSEIQMLQMVNETPDMLLMKSEAKEMIKDVLVERLTSREAEVLSMRFGLDGSPPKTLRDIGTQFGVQKQRIRQIEAKALRRLRNPGFNAYNALREELFD